MSRLMSGAEMLNQSGGIIGLSMRSTPLAPLIQADFGLEGTEKLTTQDIYDLAAAYAKKLNQPVKYGNEQNVYYVEPDGQCTII